MDSKEFGLVFGQQLTGLDDLHYGFWDDTLPSPSFLHLEAAQDRYTAQLVETLESCASGNLRVLDVGCGTGQILVALSNRGHRVDGVIPAPHLETQVRQKVETLNLNSRVWGCRMEEIATEELRHQYDIVLFSESFQYIPYKLALEQAWEALRPGGSVIICDFFKTENNGDGLPGDKSFGGGHPYRVFLEFMAQSQWRLARNDDITAQTSPNIHLIDQLLSQRVGPAFETLDTYLSGRHPWLLKLVKWTFRKKLKRLRYKYFSGHRSQAVFERYKTYRRMVLIKPEDMPT